MPDPLEIRLLGPFEVLVDGRPVEVSGSKRHAMLAMLALRRGRVVGVDALVDALWGEELPAAPRNALQHHVMRVRAALGRDAIVAASDGYSLPDAAVDAVRFEELLAETRAAMREGDVRAAADSVASAIALWRGPALHGLTETAWFSTEAARLQALRVDAREEQFEVALALGEHREIAAEIRAALEQSPFRERLWGQLMLALYRSGRQADALEIFQEARHVLSEELGLEPGPELRRLQEAILAQDPAIAPVPIAPSRRGVLPAPSTSFVGREQEVAQVVAFLDEYRLVTLTGAPGVGKTRLAVEAARSLKDEFGDRIWFVDLARADTDADVLRLLARAVDARGADPLDHVVARLGEDDGILVLDACEHVLTEAARTASALLSGCPRLRVLATSREILRLASEVRIHVEPLPLVDDVSRESSDSPAVQLFLARARAARPGFELTPETAPIAAEIARRVDGLPLGIELAAARVNVLGLAELLSTVERRLAILSGRPVSDHARAALGTLVEWSYDLLHADEKTLVHQLAVHRGGASLASLVASGAHHGLDEATVTYLVGLLVDKSIVVVSFSAGEARYDLLDTVREYALGHLTGTDGLAAAQKAHAEHFAGLADAARAGLRGPDWVDWTRRLDLDNDNLWAALAYAREAPDSGLALRLGAALGWYFALAERVSEGRRFLGLALAAASEDGPVELRTELLAHLSYLATEEMDVEAAIAAGEKGLAVGSGDEAPTQRPTVQVALALAYAQSGDEDRAARLVEEARVAFEAAGDAWGVAVSSLIKGLSAVRAGDVPTVAATAADVIRHSEGIRYDAFVVPAVLLDAWVAERREDPAGAAEAYRRALELAGEIGFADHAAFALAGLGSCAFAAGDLRQAEELLRRALIAAETANASWVAAHVRVALARVLREAGDAETAETLFRAALEWSEAPRPRNGRESLFLALAGSPAGAALLGLAELADGRGDTAAAHDLRGRAALALR